MHQSVTPILTYKPLHPAGWGMHWKQIQDAHLINFILSIEYLSYCTQLSLVLDKCVGTHTSTFHLTRLTLAEQDLVAGLEDEPDIKVSQICAFFVCL